MRIFKRYNPHMESMNLHMKLRRQLHTHRNKITANIETRPEVVISNNTGIFFTLAAILKHGKHLHPDIMLTTNCWIDHIHDEHANRDWGQTPMGIAKIYRSSFFEIFPNHRFDEYIRWGQVKQWREYILHRLEQNQVQTFRGVPSIEKLDEGYKITINDREIYKPENTFFYNLFRELNTEHSYPGLSKNSIVSLYSKASSEAPKNIIVLGGGRTAIWAAQHFPDTQFICITYNDKLPLFTEEPKPDNLLIITLDKFPGKAAMFELIADPTDPNKAMIVTTNENPEIIFSGNFFAAMGYKARPDITSQVIIDNLTSYPLSDKAWEHKWVAVEEIPIGSLMEATMRWATVTDNLSWSLELGHFHQEPFMAEFTKQVDNIGIHLPFEFFDYLKNAISKERKALDNTQIIMLYKNCLLKAYDGNIPETTLRKFEQALIGIAKEPIYQEQSQIEAEIGNDLSRLKM